MTGVLGLKKYLNSKIHRVTVTHADLDYEGSITLPNYLLEASGIAQYEAVCIWNVTQGTRLETYAIPGSDESQICINGAAAHLVAPKDIVIISSFILLDSNQGIKHKPTVVFVDEHNNVKTISDEVAGPKLR